MSRIFNGDLEGSKVRYHSNVFLVVECHYAARCPHNKGNMYEEGNGSYYTHDNSNDSSNNDEDYQNIKLLMAYENNDVEKEEVARLKD